MCKLKTAVLFFFSSIAFLSLSALAYQPKLTSPDFDFEGDSINSAPQGFDVNGPVVISDFRARTGNRSVKMTRTVSGENVRMRREIGTTPTGGVVLSIHVPSSVAADTYITLFQDSYSANPDRTIDLILRPNGEIRNRESGGQVTIGSYNLGSWNDIEISWINLSSTNSYSLKVNGTLVGSFPTEKTGKTPKRFEIKYGASTSPTGSANIFVDTVSFTVPDFDFESNSLNNSPPDFDTAGPVVVSNDRARSGSRSVRMTRVTSGANVRMRREFGSAASGRTELSIYVPSSVVADTYISLFQDSYSVNPDRVIDLMLRPNGDLRNRESGGQTTIGSYNLGAWNDLEILWTNLPSSNQYTLILNGAVLGTFPTERTGKTPTRFEIKYGASTSDTGPASIYIDRVSVGGDAGGGSYSFDLGKWKITLPDGTERTTQWLLDGNTSSNEFYYNGDGSMVFRSPNIAGSTSGSSYSRSELREMLRGTDTSIPTRGFTKNNWVFSTSSSSIKNQMGGIDGNMKATLKVDHVSTTGDAGKVGRVIIGQIHASDDEPLRLYYRKLPNNSRGSIYFAHETPNGSDTWYEMIGSRSNSASNPSDGIALGEVFSYEVDVKGLQLKVTIKRPGKSDVVQTITMNSGYNDDWMYFKAGVYNQNNSGTSSDYVQATFYNLVVTHD
jgi:hypothetical protein